MKVDMESEGGDQKTKPAEWQCTDRQTWVVFCVYVCVCVRGRYVAQE